MLRLRLLVAGLALAALVPAAALAGFRATDAALPGLMTSKAPWGPNNGPLLQARLAASGLPALTAEGAALHIHQHLDLFVKGRAVPVPAFLGIDAQSRFIAEIHTHDESGMIHVEAPRIQPFTVGQLFDVWGLRLTRTCLGGYCAGGGNRVWTWVNGKRWKGDPRRIVLRQHVEVVVAFGTFEELPRPIPKTFAFPAGQ